MKKLLLGFSIFAFAATVNAQDASTKTTTKGGTKFEIGASVGTGTQSGSKLTYGGDVRVKAPVSSGLQVVGSAGYQTHNFNYSGYKYNLNFIPIKAGLQYLLGSSIFAEALAGYAINTDSGGHFTYSAGIGTMLSSIVLSLMYNSISDLNAVMLRVAFALGGNK